MKQRGHGLRNRESNGMKQSVKQILVLFNIKHPYDRKIIDGIVEASQNSKKNVQLTFMTYDEAMLIARDHQWSAIIADFDRDRNIDLCNTLNAPVVGVISNRINLPQLHFANAIYLVPDNDRICELARDHLLACGTKNFAYFAGMADEIGTWSDERKNSFKAQVTDANLHWIGDFNTHNIREHLQNSNLRNSGYLCASDTQARQLISLAHNLGIDVPGQISVIGIDNDEVENQLSLVPISSITLDLNNLGRKAFEALFDLHNIKNNTIISIFRSYQWFRGRRCTWCFIIT